jgi:hypothetical protein
MHTQPAAEDIDWEGSHHIRQCTEHISTAQQGRQRNSREHQYDHNGVEPDCGEVQVAQDKWIPPGADASDVRGRAYM